METIDLAPEAERKAELDGWRELIKDIDKLLKLPVKQAMQHHTEMKYKASQWSYWKTMQDIYLERYPDLNPNKTK